MIVHWEAIVTAASILIAPTLAALVKSRIDQPKQTPAPSQPASRSQRTGGWFSQLVPWVLVLFIVLNLVDLVSAFRTTAPLTRRDVFWIVALVAGILINLGALAYISMLKLFRRLLEVMTH